MGMPSPGGGEGPDEPDTHVATNRAEGLEREVVRPWAHVGDPRRHLTREEITKIKRLHVVPPTDTAFYEQLIIDTRREERWFKVFLAKHYIDLIKELGMHASKSQKQFVSNWKDPEWFTQAVLLDAKKREKREKREKRDKGEKPADPDPSDIPAWTRLLAENVFRRPHGIRFEENKPDQAQLQGWLIFKQIGPARPGTKEESRRTRNVANHVICRYFAEHAEEYRGTVMSLGCTISEMWAPSPYPHGENVEINDFLKHAANCGLQHEMAEGPLRAFAIQWLADYTGPTVA